MSSSDRSGWPRTDRHRAGHPAPTSACWAPASQLYVFPDGNVRSCCLTSSILGHLATDRLPDIWHGSRRSAMVDALADGDFGVGCDACDAEVALEGRPGSYPEQFDHLAPSTGEHHEWPSVMAFYLSNACNLQCIQCNGDNSSAIRLHREHRPPLQSPLDDRFFEDLREFLPHLRQASFVGGEPFLAGEAFRVWDLIAECAPGLATSACTNATQWNRRVERVLEQHHVDCILSIDGASKATFEAIRVGADFDEVVRNIDRFREVSARRGTTLQINHCLMPQNAHEFPEMLLFAEARGIGVSVSVVRDPIEFSLLGLPAAELADLVGHLESRSAALLPSLTINRDTWETELRRLRTWAATPAEEAVELRGPRRRQIVALDRRGSGQTDLEAISADVLIRGHASEEFRMWVGPGDLVLRLSDGFEEFLGIAPGSLVGANALDAQRAVMARFRSPGVWTERVVDEHTALSHAEFPSGHLDIARIALRDHSGWADEVAIVIVFTPAERSPGSPV